MKQPSPPVDLYLIFEKSIWKNPVRRTGFLVYFNWIFTACVAYKNQFQNCFLQVKNPVCWTWFFKNQVHINRGWGWSIDQLRSKKSVLTINRSMFVSYDKITGYIAIVLNKWGNGIYGQIIACQWKRISPKKSQRKEKDYKFTL